MEDTAQTPQETQDEEPACSSGSIHAPSVTIAPAWSDWKSALSSKRQSAARGEIGLDTDRPIVMSGHQPIVFHNGILAKLIALDEAARRTNAQAVWIVPDQDAVDPGVIRVPTGSRDSLAAEVIELLPNGAAAGGVSAGSLSAAQVDEPACELLKPIVRWLDQYAGMETLAGQFGYATIEYACERLGIDTPRLIFASELFASDALFAIIKTMRDDPALCAQSYNNAIAKHPDAGVRALVIEDDRIELPLWGCRANEARVAIDSTNIGSFERDELLPRGVLMSAMARAHLADLFIHGTGGWVYDRISEDWFADWVGIKLVPMAMVSATHRLEFGFSPDEMVDAGQAAWEAHHARHTPAMVGDGKAQQRKDELVLQIRQLDPKDPQRAVLYGRLQGLLAAYRDEHHTEIESFVQRTEQAKARAGQHELARDRTWAFVFFGQEALEVLDRATREAMG